MFRRVLLLASLLALAPAAAVAQSDVELESFARGELDLANASLVRWHDELHIEADALHLTLPSAELAGPAATMILGGLVGLTGGITALMSIEEAPHAVHQTGLVLLGVGGGLLVFGIVWLVERLANRHTGEAGQRYRRIGRALNRIHREMRRRPGMARPER